MIRVIAVLLALLAPDAVRAQAIDPAAPPDERAVIRALLSIAETTLPRARGCPSVGMTDTADVGDYVAAIVSSLADRRGTRGLTVTVRPDMLRGARVWAATVVFQRQLGEEVWRWGVAFALDPVDRRVVPGSAGCAPVNAMD
jgi:hypothetical protein